MEFKIGYVDDFEVGKIDLRFKKNIMYGLLEISESIYAYQLYVLI